MVAFCCAEDIPVPDMETERLDNPDYETIQLLGYSIEGIIEEDDLYVVEGDILIDKTYLDSLKSVSTTRQAREKSIITGGRENNIRLKFTSAQVPSVDWRAAIRDAINIWNAVPNCNVHFNGIESPIIDVEIVWIFRP